MYSKLSSIYSSDFSGGRLRSDSGEITLEDISDANLLKFTPESGSKVGSPVNEVQINQRKRLFVVSGNFLCGLCLVKVTPDLAAGLWCNLSANG